MRLGDVLEWVAAAGLVAAGYLGTHMVWVALLIGAICLAYFAQCHATTEIPKFRLRFKFPRPHIKLPRNVRARITVSFRLWRQLHSN